MIDWRGGRGAIAALALLSLATTVLFGWGEGLWSFAARCDNRDTITFYYAAQAARLGLDPYDNPALLQQFGVFVWWVYPPSALPAFMPMTLLPFAQAAIAFNLGKFAALLGLGWLWLKIFPILRRDLAFGLFALAALNTTLLQDWCSGNIAAFESLAIWGAVWLLLQRRAVLAVALIAGLSLIKPLWLIALLLPVLMLPRHRPAWRAGAIALGVAAAAGLMWLALDAASFVSWLHNARSTLSIRYNVFELVKDIRIGLGGELALPPWQRPEYAIYAAWCGAVAFLALRRWRRDGDGLTRAALLLLAIAATSPANLSYSWLFVVPAVYLAMRQLPVWGQIALALPALLPPPMLAMLLPLRDVGMASLIVVIVAFLSLAILPPHRSIAMQRID